MNRKPIFNNVSWNDLFTGLTEKENKFTYNGKSLNNKNWYISGFMQIRNIRDNRESNYKSLYIIPTNKTLQAINDNMLKIDYDTIHFEIIIWENNDNMAVYLQYNQILGNRLLAYISKNQLPIQSIYDLLYL